METVKILTAIITFAIVAVLFTAHEKYESREQKWQFSATFGAIFLVKTAFSLGLSKIIYGDDFYELFAIIALIGMSRIVVDFVHKKLNLHRFGLIIFGLTVCGLALHLAFPI